MERRDEVTRNDLYVEDTRDLRLEQLLSSDREVSLEAAEMVGNRYFDDPFLACGVDFRPPVIVVNGFVSGRYVEIEITVMGSMDEPS